MFRLLPMRKALLILAAPLLTLASCGPPRTGLGLHAYQSYDLPAKAATNPAAVEVKVSLARQRAYVTEGQRILLAMPVSVGTAETPTPAGRFRILVMDARHRSPTDGFATKGSEIRRTRRHNTPPGWKFTGRPLPYWCGFTPTLGFHTGWIKHSPCTDGCIRMHENIAPKFFALVRTGTPVHIATTQPEDRDHAFIPLPPDSGPLPDHPHAYYLGDDAFR